MIAEALYGFYGQEILGFVSCKARPARGPFARPRRAQPREEENARDTFRSYGGAGIVCGCIVQLEAKTGGIQIQSSPIPAQGSPDVFAVQTDAASLTSEARSLGCYSSALGSLKSFAAFKRPVVRKASICSDLNLPKLVLGGRRQSPNDHY